MRTFVILHAFSQVKDHASRRQEGQPAEYDQRCERHQGSRRVERVNDRVYWQLGRKDEPQVHGDVAEGVCLPPQEVVTIEREVREEGVDEKLRTIPRYIDIRVGFTVTPLFLDDTCILMFKDCILTSNVLTTICGGRVHYISPPPLSLFYIGLSDFFFHACC